MRPIAKQMFYRQLYLQMADINTKRNLPLMCGPIKAIFKFWRRSGKTLSS